MEQTKALNALEPFIALSKSATSPRAAADLITRATSAANTFVFAELLQTPQIQNLSTSEYSTHLTLLKIFSHGTYESYHATPNLPPLNDAQTLKLRQLSLLSLATDRSNLSYENLQRALGLASTRQLESLVITAVYAGLLDATLDPARQAVQVSSVAPLRDIAPDSVPDMISALKAWSDRCTSTLQDLETHAINTRAQAMTRAQSDKLADDKLKRLTAELRDADKKLDGTGAARETLARRGLNKRSMVEVGKTPSDEVMDIDRSISPEDQKKRASKRKM